MTTDIPGGSYTACEHLLPVAYARARLLFGNRFHCTSVPISIYIYMRPTTAISNEPVSGRILNKATVVQ